MFRSSDPGPDGAVFYVSFMEPVLKGADYNIAHILEDELPEQKAQELVEELVATLSQRQSTLDLDHVLSLWAEP